MDKSQSAASIFNKYATEYEQKFMNIDLYKNSFDLFCQAIAKEQANILEVACGPGNITQYILKIRPHYKILGLDLAPNMIALAKANNPSASFEIMDARDISQLHQKYDGFMVGFCFPYLSKPEAIKFIYDAATLLKPGGVIYISTMEDDHAASGYKKGSKGDEIYVNFHEAGYLTQALEQNGFTILSIQRQDFPTEAETNITDLLLIAQK